MGNITRTDFSGGWQPSADLMNCPRNALLRMDNCVLDEIGAVALRRGSEKINSTAFADDDVDIHSLFTASLSSTRYRMSGCTDAVYANGVSIASSLAGEDEVTFGAHMGQILFARSTSKKKYDGTTVRTWGIAAPNAAPTLAGIAADSKTFSTCASSESPGMTQNEGTQSFTTDKAGTANAAVQIVPDATTARGTSTKTFATATDFTSYTGGQTGTDEDLIELYAYVTEPQYMDRITLMIDVNDGTFQEDYYVYHFVNGEPVEVRLDTQEVLDSDYDLEGFDRDDVRSRLETRGIETEFRIDKPVSDAGWNHFSVPRGKMRRIGSTSGKNWSTVKAVRVSFVGLAGGSGAAVRFDEIKIIGGASRGLTGRYKAAVVAVRNDGTYEALSAPSATSSELEVKAQGIRATVGSSVISSLDSQVTELWLYLMGGRLDGFYRAAKLTGGPFTGAQTIDATDGDIAILTANLRMGTNLTTPPDDIIGIEGPHYDRTLCLTAEFVYPSQQRNPDSYNSTEAVRVGDDAETALWIKKLNEQLYVGTTRDIYRLDGDWTVRPDGSLNIAKRPLGVSVPPMGARAVAVGNVLGAETLIYLTGSGWKVLGGPLLTSSGVDLLWGGYTRYGISPVNITDTTSRLRVAINRNSLYALTPEGFFNSSSRVLHVYNFVRQRWYRFRYPATFRSILAEPDGALIAGSADGFVWRLETAAKHDDGTGIAVSIWTGADDGGLPFNEKEALNLQVLADTGDVSAIVTVHINGESTPAVSTSAGQAVSEVGSINLGDEELAFRHAQVRISGTFIQFYLRGLDLGYRNNPIPVKFHDTGFTDLDPGMIQWVRKIRVKAKSPVNMTVTPYWDGTAGTARTITVGAQAGKVSVFEVPLGREDKGRTARTVVTSTSPSSVYWVEYELNGSGKQRSKRQVRVGVLG